MLLSLNENRFPVYCVKPYLTAVSISDSNSVFLLRNVYLSKKPKSFHLARFIDLPVLPLRSGSHQSNHNKIQSFFLHCSIVKVHRHSWPQVCDICPFYMKPMYVWDYNLYYWLCLLICLINMWNPVWVYPS